MIFASDLDNTLIHSYKTAKSGDICVEVKDGKELSFMSPQTHLLLKDIAERYIFLPVTTRSLEQYLRIDLGVKPKYAVIAHGALLLVDGKTDEAWSVETRKLLKSPLPKLDSTVVSDTLLYDIRYVENFFIFAKSEEPIKAVEYLKTILKTRIDQELFEIYAVHNKVYIFPVGLNKGVAVNRLKNRLQIQRVMCAGDSKLDIPMLETADIAIVPQSLGLSGKHYRILPDEKFTSEILAFTATDNYP